MSTVSACLGDKVHTDKKKEKTEKHKKAESGYAKRLQGNLQGENENEESENEYIILGGFCRLCLCLEHTHTQAHWNKKRHKTGEMRQEKKVLTEEDEEEWHSWELASFLRARWMWLKKSAFFM